MIYLDTDYNLSRPILIPTSTVNGLAKSLEGIVHGAVAPCVAHRTPDNPRVIRAEY